MTEQQKAKRLTKKQKVIIAAIKSGAKLRCQIGEPAYFIDGGDTVNRRTVLCLVRAGVLKPADSLIDGFPQTFELVTEG